MDNYHIVIVAIPSEDGGGYLGLVPDLPGCISDGETRAEAVESTEAAIVEWMETQKNRGFAIPKPGSFSDMMNERNQKNAKILSDLLDDIKKAKLNMQSFDERIEAVEKDMKEVLEMIENLEQRQNFEQIIGFGRENDRVKLVSVC